jgi:3-phosphoshikimate 1-carboxyvinyltransferase
LKIPPEKTMIQSKKIVPPKEIQFLDIQIQLPASKSISNRALVLNALSYSPYEIRNLSVCDDTDVMVKAFDSNSSTFDVGAAGTSMRFLTAFLSKTVGEWIITGSERMKQRPIKILVDALNQLGGKIEYIEKEGFPPLKIYGSALMGGEIKLNGSISSQYISALMMIAPYMYNGLTIELEGTIISKPYIVMTQKMMLQYGVKATFDDKKIKIKPQIYTPILFSVESDWSAASYWYEILCFAGKGKIELQGLTKSSLQGDSKIASIFENFGIKTDFIENKAVLTINEKTDLDYFEYDFVETPDLAQTIVVTCCLKNVKFNFSGLQSLKIKETNRVEALITELGKLGFELYEPKVGSLAWNGNFSKKEEIPSISTYEDHRMAMAFAPVGLLRSINIENPQVVSKSYPTFWNDFCQIL